MYFDVVTLVEAFLSAVTCFKQQALSS